VNKSTVHKTEKKPVVSIIVPTYNRAQFITRAVQSVLDQTFKDFELLVVDDASEDNTGEVLKKISDRRVKYIRLEKNIGAAAARNRGIIESKGDYIAFQDSDDEWLPDKLSRQMSVFKKEGDLVGVVYTPVWRIKKDKSRYMVPPENMRNLEGLIRDELLNENFIALPSAIVRKSCFSVVGMFNEKLPCLQDWDLWIRISAKYHFKYINQPLLNAYYSADSISINYKKLISAWELILDAYLRDFKKQRKSLSKKYLFIAHLENICENPGGCRKYLFRSLVEYPLNIRALFFILVCFFGQKTYRAMISKLYQI
jgi:glycosyltransferase involved in cell wall biosynthesis